MSLQTVLTPVVPSSNAGEPGWAVLARLGSALRAPCPRRPDDGAEEPDHAVVIG